MKDLINSIFNRHTIAIVGQILIIGGLLATTGLVWRISKTKPRTFYYIIINRIRYMLMIAKEEGFKKIITHFFKNNELPDHPYNYSYKWLMENKIFIAYPFYILCSLELVFQMVSQISSGYVFQKSPDFFISSPIRSICTYYIIAFLYAEALRWKKKYLQAMKNNGKIVDATDSFHIAE